MLITALFDVCHIVGLNSSVASYAECFTEAGITGRQLLMLTNDDLEQIGVKKLGHQEILLQSIALLQSLVRLTACVSAGKASLLKTEIYIYKSIPYLCILFVKLMISNWLAFVYIWYIL